MAAAAGREAVIDGRGAAEIVADPVPPARTGAGTGKRKRRGFPSPLGILLLVMAAVWLLAMLIPSGVYDLDENGAPIAGSYHSVESPLDFAGRVRDLLLAPVNGLLGIVDPATGQVGPFNSGWMFGSVQVFLFILAIGGFMTVVFKTGSLDLGISRLAHRFASRGPVLIVVLSVLFGFLGSVMSWSDESLGFYALLIPLLLALGYDRMTGVAVITVAPFVGAIGSTITPFRIGVGSDAAGVSIADGLGLRLLLFVVSMAVMIVYTLRYAKKVKADPSAAIVPHDPEDLELVEGAGSEDLPRLTGRDKAVISLLALTFALLIFSIVPWSSILNATTIDPLTHESVAKVFSFRMPRVRSSPRPAQHAEKRRHEPFPGADHPGGRHRRDLASGCLRGRGRGERPDDGGAGGRSRSCRGRVDPGSVRPEICTARIVRGPFPGTPSACPESRPERES